MSLVTGMPTELMFSNRADFTQLDTFTTDASLLAGLNEQPIIPANFFDHRGYAKSLLIVASGVLSTTGAPTWTFRFRRAGRSR